ncbi:hypothetical protein HGB07_02265 [Candidatus Roizmanbacteria bacterium]|nr:hypothetical protein [Candidatus Roizmanbacteria bacterium]
MPMLQNEIARLDASIIPHTLAIQWSSGGSLDEAFLSAIESQNLIYHWEQRASGIDAEKVRSQAENAPLVSAAVWMLKR